MRAWLALAVLLAGCASPHSASSPTAPANVAEPASLPLDIKENDTILGPGIEAVTGLVGGCAVPSGCRSYIFDIKGNGTAVVDATISAQLWDDYDLVLLQDGKEIKAARTHASWLEHLNANVPPGRYTLLVVGYIATSAPPVESSSFNLQVHFSWA